MNRVRWDEANAHIIALHLRKRADAMSNKPHRSWYNERHAACECESSCVTNIALALDMEP
jgi:hypothetical protein